MGARPSLISPFPVHSIALVVLGEPSSIVMIDDYCLQIIAPSIIPS